MELLAQTRDVLSFGPFSLVVSERIFTREGVALQLGARTLDTLIALVSHPNQPVSKRDLMALVWPDVTVDEGSLRFHIASLRKALGDGKDGARYITTLAGRGYCFVAPVSRASPRGSASTAAAIALPHANVPSRLVRMVGRADGILMVSTQLVATRFVTIIGAGGVGKTTIAVAVGHDLMEAFAGAVLFVDLGALTDPKLTATSLATMLGLSVQSADPIPGLIAYLRDKRILLILDNCEHLIEAAAILAARIFAAAPRVHILATSRDPLRVEGEHVYRLAPLAFPPDEAGLTIADALTFPAIQLFVERAAANGANLDLKDSDVAVLAGVCRKLDGIALAIELAAGRVEAYGLDQTAALLEERLSPLWLGQRTAPQRQQTLRATLDWSYDLLLNMERQVLRHLAVFAGSFTREAARAVLVSSAIDQNSVLAAIGSLVAKSLVASDGVAPAGRWRLLESVRVYALEKLGESSETARAARSHAAFFRSFVVSAAPSSRLDTTLNNLTRCSREIDNIRTALDWAFSPDGDVEIGLSLTAAYVPVWLHFAWYMECHDRTQHALDSARPGSNIETPVRMQLHCGLGMAMLYAMEPTKGVAAILARALQLAELAGDDDAQLRILWALWIVRVDTCDLHAGQIMAERFASIARRGDDPAVTLVAERITAYTLQFSGDHPAARGSLERVLNLYDAPMDLRHRTWFLHDQRLAAQDMLARSLWLQGFVDQAAAQAHAILKEAEASHNLLSTCEALRLAVCPITLATGDLGAAERAVVALTEHSTRHNSIYFMIAGRCLEAELLIRREEFSKGVALLSEALNSSGKAGWAVCYPAFQGVLAEGLAGLGRFADALLAVERALQAATRGGERWSLPELLRIKGECLLRGGHPTQAAAEDCFTEALDVARRQGALFWELRAAMGFARLRLRQSEPDGAREILAPVYDQFTEGFETTDLKSAKQLLVTLG